MYICVEGSNIDAYRVLNGRKFVCFLDASKAFDRANNSVCLGLLVEEFQMTLFVY